MTNLYEVLGVRPTATAEEVKSAYRRCALEAHPDRKGDAERFRRVQEAYSTLGDLEKRGAYDQARSAWMRQIGAIGCPACGNANRITRLPAAAEVARCGRCKAQLPISLSDLLTAQRQSLVHEAARFVDDVGLDLAELAADAVKSGIARVRERLGLRRATRLKSFKP